LIDDMIVVKDLTFDYPGFRALHGVSFSIPAGSVTALVGPNGAGKTTLMRCIAALDMPLSGGVQVAGVDVFEFPRDVHRRMGYLSDSFGLYSELTVAQGLEYSARSQGLGTTAVAAAVRDTAQRMGLADKLTSQAKALSRGQRQRLAIGQAIIHGPQVLLLDEPASGLDPEARSALAQVFRDLQAHGMTLLVSSHILAELDEYSTHMLAINLGRVLEHRALASPLKAHISAQRHLRMEFLGEGTDAALWLAQQSDVHLNLADGSRAELLLDGDSTAQAALVRSCILAGFDLLHVSTVTENLQQSYLRSLAASRTGANSTTPGSPK
jgi:ABC-2 type transport system ATP-binding protein